MPDAPLDPSSTSTFLPGVTPPVQPNLPTHTRPDPAPYPRSVRALAERILSDARRPYSDRICTVFIDGRSGAGKTTFAAELSHQTGFRLVHLDDFYPGWAGLAAGSRMVARDVLDPQRPGYWSWDWEANTTGPWVPLTGGEPLIIEGVGAITWDNLTAARKRGGVLSILIEAAPEKRRTRALLRDPGYRPYWDMWAEQEERHFSSAFPWGEIDARIHT